MLCRLLTDLCLYYMETSREQCVQYYVEIYYKNISELFNTLIINSKANHSQMFFLHMLRIYQITNLTTIFVLVNLVIKLNVGIGSGAH